jgi:hypothetical protein
VANVSAKAKCVKAGLSQAHINKLEGAVKDPGSIDWAALLAVIEKDGLPLVLDIIAALTGGTVP